MKTLNFLIRTIVVSICLIFIGCEDFVETNIPNHIVSSEVVFENDETARSAMKGIYNQLIRTSFSGGWENSVTILAGLSSDNLTTLWQTNMDYVEFDEHSIIPDNSRNLQLWSGAYNMIYMCNSVLEGISNSNNLSAEVQESLEAEAKFIRAFTYFYLVNLYGNVPLLLTRDYDTNALASQNSKEEIYQQILTDLNQAEALLEAEYRDQERMYINRFAVTALLARVHLYLHNYQEAENYSSQVIMQNDQYELLENLDEVFSANSREAIWQISPIGLGGSLTYTYDGYIMIIDPNSSSLNPVKLTTNLVNSFDAGDERLSEWIGYDEGTGSYYAYKYKDRNSTNDITEYSMVLRLAEQYLIRAEARMQQGSISGAIADVDVIRERAGLSLIAEVNPGIGEEALLNEILIERKRELFAEWGHRWLDLKRSETASEVLGNNNSSWQSTDIRYPIPEEERMKNPNLGQNPGY